MARVPDLAPVQDTGTLRWLRAWLDDLRTLLRMRDPQATTVGNPLEKYVTRRELTERGIYPARDGLPTVTRRHTEVIGDGSTTVFAIKHGLGTREIAVSLRNTTTGAITSPTNAVASTPDTLTLTFGAAPAAGAVSVSVIG